MRVEMDEAQGTRQRERKEVMKDTVGNRTEVKNQNGR